MSALQEAFDQWLGSQPWLRPYPQAAASLWFSRALQRDGAAEALVDPPSTHHLALMERFVQATIAYLDTEADQDPYDFFERLADQSWPGATKR